MEKVLFKATTRGHANHGWLDTYHTFSFANYYNPDRIHFGALRVVNDDIVAGGKGFGRHHHDNMEIVSIPLSGDLEHQDSMGHKSIIKSGDVQVMSAGTGVYHSEYNANTDSPVNFFQIWVFPAVENVIPRYDQKSFDFNHRKNEWIKIVSSDVEKEEDMLWIHQDASFYIGTFDKEVEGNFKVIKPNHGLFAMVIEGEFEVAGEQLNRRDAIGVWDTASVDIKALSSDAKMLLIAVPMIK